MFGLALSIVGILIVAIREIIEKSLPERRAQAISLPLLVFGALLAIIGATLQFGENQRLHYQVTEMFQRDIEHVRRLGTHAFDLGKLAVAYFVQFEDEVLGRPDPYDIRSWLLLDLEHGIKTLQTVFDVTFQSISVEEAKERYTIETPPQNYFRVMDDVYGSDRYYNEAATKIWATSPSSTTVEYWFYLSWEVESLTHLLKHGLYESTNSSDDELYRIIYIGSALGLPREIFERWMADLLTLEGDALNGRTDYLMLEIEHYKRVVWDTNPFAYHKPDRFQQFE